MAGLLDDLKGCTEDRGTVLDDVIGGLAVALLIGLALAAAAAWIAETFPLEALS